MATYSDFLDALRATIGSLVSDLAADLKIKAKADADAWLKDCEKDLQHWTQELADGDLRKGDYEELILGQRDLLKMKALTEAGLAKVRLDKFKDDLIAAVISTACKIFIGV